MNKRMEGRKRMQLQKKSKQRKNCNGFNALEGTGSARKKRRKEYIFNYIFYLWIL
jgi:hypothetical protein